MPKPIVEASVLAPIALVTVLWITRSATEAIIVGLLVWVILCILGRRRNAP